MTLSILALFAATAVASYSSDSQVLVAAVSHDKELDFDSSPPSCELTSASENSHLNVHDLNALATLFYVACLNFEEISGAFRYCGRGI